MVEQFSSRHPERDVVMTPKAHLNVGSLDIASNAIDAAVMSGVNEAITTKEVAKYLKPITAKMSINCTKKTVCDMLLV